MAKKVTALQFFKARFPEKDPNAWYEKTYFNEWKTRFKSGTPEAHMDRDSIAVFAKLKGVPAKKVEQVCEAKKKLWWKAGDAGVKSKRWY